MDTLITRFTVSPDVRSSNDNDGSTILHITQDKIYSIIGVGSLIWTRLVASQSGLAREDIIEELTSEFKDVPHERIERDVEQLLSSFHNKGLIQARAEQKQLGQFRRDGGSWAFTFLVHGLAGALLKLKLCSLAAFLGLGTVDFLLKFVSFHALYSLVKRWPINTKSTGLEMIEEIDGAVTKAITWYPKQAMCLQRSAVMTCLLRSRGVPATLMIGCQKLPFLAHAWVEVDGEVVNDVRRVQEIHKVLDRC